MTIRDGSGTVWTGYVNGFTSLSLGSFAAGAARSFSISLAFPTADADPLLQGSGFELVLAVGGVST
jgi:hypothetical protein